MPLTDTSIRNSKPRAKPFKLADGKGLFLQVTPTGSKRWRIKYRFEGKEKLLSLGIYPETSLAKARERCDAARKQLADGIDPAQHRKATKASKAELVTNSFEVVAREWHTKHAVRDPNGRAYNRTAHLAERRKMMQVWADYLDALKTQSKVTPGGSLYKCEVA
jgi:hypothetical protein